MSTDPDLVALADLWAVDYWRLWVELARYTNRCAAMRQGGKGPRPPAIVPVAPFLDAVRHQQLRGDQGTMRARLIRARKCGYLTIATATKACDDHGLRPEIVWGARWHAVTALLAEGLVK